MSPFQCIRQPAEWQASRSPGRGRGHNRGAGSIQTNVSDQSAATGGPATTPDATAARLHPLVRLHRSSAVCDRTGDRLPSRRRLSYRARDATASIFSSRAVAPRFFGPGQASPGWPGLARGRARFVDSGNAIADRRERSERSWEPKDLVNGGSAATAELASVERCSAPETRHPRA